MLKERIDATTNNYPLGQSLLWHQDGEHTVLCGIRCGSGTLCALIALVGLLWVEVQERQASVHRRLPVCSRRRQLKLKKSVNSLFVNFGYVK